jgi:hypothetical protein
LILKKAGIKYNGKQKWQARQPVSQKNPSGAKTISRFHFFKNFPTL